MKVIGLTGPSGSGKTLFCRLAEDFGIRSINADEIYHQLLIPPSPCLDEIVSVFGKDVLNTDGRLDRPKLGSIVFSDSERLSCLNAITHKYVIDKFRAIIKEMDHRGEKSVIVDAPTLFESGFNKECDVTLCLLADTYARKQRIIDRDKLTSERAEQRLAAQKDDSFYISKSDHVIRNNGSPENLKAAIASFLQANKIITKEDK